MSRMWMNQCLTTNNWNPLFEKFHLLKKPLTKFKKWNLRLRFWETDSKVSTPVSRRNKKLLKNGDFVLEILITFCKKMEINWISSIFLYFLRKKKTKLLVYSSIKDECNWKYNFRRNTHNWIWDRVRLSR